MMLIREPKMKSDDKAVKHFEQYKTKRGVEWLQLSLHGNHAQMEQASSSKKGRGLNDIIKWNGIEK